MSGTRINKAKEALIIFLKSLPTDSYFNIISFGSNCIKLYNKSQIYSTETLRTLKRRRYFQLVMQHNLCRFRINPRPALNQQKRLWLILILLGPPAGASPGSSLNLASSCSIFILGESKNIGRVENF